MELFLIIFFTIFFMICILASSEYNKQLIRDKFVIGKLCFALLTNNMEDVDKILNKFGLGLLKEDVSSHVPEIKQRATILDFCCAHGNLKAIRLLLDKGALSVYGGLHYSLSIAMNQGHFEAAHMVFTELTQKNYYISDELERECRKIFGNSLYQGASAGISTAATSQEEAWYDFGIYNPTK